MGRSDGRGELKPVPLRAGRLPPLRGDAARPRGSGDALLRRRVAGPHRRGAARRRRWSISRTACAVWSQVQLRQMPSFFCRIQTLSPRRRAAFQNIAGIVSPGTTMSSRDWMRPRSQRPAGALACMAWVISMSSSFSSAARRAHRRPSCPGRTPLCRPSGPGARSGLPTRCLRLEVAYIG